MSLKYYLRFQGNENDVDFETLLKVGEAFSLLLNAAAHQIALSSDITRPKYNELKKQQFVTLSMQQTEKGSCVIPILVDLINAIDIEAFKAAVDYVLTSASNLFNDEMARGVLYAAISDIAIRGGEKFISAVSKKRREKKAASELNANVYDIADRETKGILANEEVRQATINLFRALNSTSLNTNYSYKTILIHLF